MNWQINYNNFHKGYSPNYWSTTYPSFGELGMAGDMKNVDLTSPNYITQGDGILAMTGTITTLPRGILKHSVITSAYSSTDPTSFAVGGTQLYLLSETNLLSGAGFPHTIKRISKTVSTRPYANTASTYLGTPTEWTNPENAYESNDTYATSDNSSKESCWYSFKNEGGTSTLSDLLPSLAVISGVEVEIDAKCANDNVSVTLAVTLTKDYGSTFIGTYNSSSISTTEGTVTVGGNGDLWGASLLKSDFGDGFGICVKANNSSTNTTSIDQIRVIVYYEEGSQLNIVAEDVDYFGDKIMYSFNTATEGRVGSYNLTSGVFNEREYIALEKDVPHQSVVAGNNGIYTVLNGGKVATYDGEFWEEDSFDNKDSSEILNSIVWNQNKFHISGNKPDLTVGRVRGSIYIWDGVSNGWDYRIETNGRIESLYVKDGITYVFYKERIKEGVSTIGYLEGNVVRRLRDWYGDCPKYYQISEYKGFIIFMSSDKVMAFGSPDPRIEKYLFNLTTSTYSTAGGLSSCFDRPIVASMKTVGETNTYELGRFYGYKTDSYWYGLLSDIRATDRMGKIDSVKINTEQLTEANKAIISLKNNDATSLFNETISYSTDGAILRKDFYAGGQGENARLEISWEGASATNPTKIRSINITGKTIK